MNIKIKNKKAASLLFQNIFYIVFTIAILLILIWYTNDVTKREDFQKQTIAKQMSLLIDASEPETTFDLSHANISISQKENKITAKTQLEFDYGFFNSNIMNLYSKDGKTQIIIS